MSKKKMNNTKQSPASRFQKENVPQKDNKKKILLPLFLVLLLCAAGTGIWIGTSIIGKKGGVSLAVAEAAEVTYPLSTFSDGKARHFEYQSKEGHTIRYFILKSADGVIRAAFDACDVCWPANKGYFQQGDNMVCRNCGRKFASVKVNEVKGGCNPAPLARNVVDDRLVIRIQDIIEGKRFFDFSGRG